MALSYANILDRVEQLLQDPTNAIFSTTELGYWMEDGLKDFSRFLPVIVEAIYHIETRTGTDTAGTATALTDTSKSQFVATDETTQKVIHNTKDSTWAVVKNYTSSSVLVLSRDIMGSGDSYEMYNKQCANQKQIYLGDYPAHLWIDSVEYPIGSPRNFTQPSWNVVELEIDDSVLQDSDSTIDPPNDTRVLIRFAMPQVVSQLTAWEGEASGAAAEAASTIDIDGMGTTETIEVGEMFNMEDHLTTYIITTEVTMAEGAGSIVFYPPLESAVLNNDDITFIKTTLKPNEEALFCRLVAAKAAMSKSVIAPLKTMERALPNLDAGGFTIDESNKGGPGTPTDYLNYANAERQMAAVYKDYREWGEREMARVLMELERLATPRAHEEYART